LLQAESIRCPSSCFFDHFPGAGGFAASPGEMAWSKAGVFSRTSENLAMTSIRVSSDDEFVGFGMLGDAAVVEDQIGERRWLGAESE
jgi:hypothetical protein